jgi:glycerate kinase
MIVRLDRALAHYARIIQRDLAVDVLHLEGGGAAGGMGAACMHSVARGCVRALRL